APADGAVYVAPLGPDDTDVECGGAVPRAGRAGPPLLGLGDVLLGVAEIGHGEGAQGEPHVRRAAVALLGLDGVALAPVVLAEVGGGLGDAAGGGAGEDLVRLVLVAGAAEAGGQVVGGAGVVQVGGRAVPGAGLVEVALVLLGQADPGGGLGERQVERSPVPDQGSGVGVGASAQVAQLQRGERGACVAGPL